MKIKVMEEAGIIRKSKSPWSAPMIIIPKKDGDIRPCVDYRKLNSITVTRIHSDSAYTGYFGGYFGFRNFLVIRF